MGDIFFDHPPDGAVNENEVVASECAALRVGQITSISRHKFGRVGLAWQFEFLPAITKIKPPLVMAVLEARDVF